MSENHSYWNFPSSQGFDLKIVWPAISVKKATTGNTYHPYLTLSMRSEKLIAHKVMVLLLV